MFMPEVATTYREAVRQALRDLLSQDPTVILLGEDIAAAGGSFRVTEGLLDTFGSRVIDTPISETGFVGAAIGMALAGYKPIVELMFADFAAVAYDQIVNEAAKYLYLSAGQMPVPMVVRMAGGAGLGFASQHSQTTESWYANIPGLKVVVPSNPQDAYGLMLAAAADPNPVIYIEHKKLYAIKGALDTAKGAIPLGVANIARPGRDITAVASLAMVGEALLAADTLAARGIDMEVIDIRSLVPLDLETILNSVAKTSRLIVIEEQPVAGGWGGDVVASVCEVAFDTLDLPPARLGTAAAPIPFSPQLEGIAVPRAQTIVARVEGMLLG
jgi:pyruvate dehydrogenase E1 component beta subunit